MPGTGVVQECVYNCKATTCDHKLGDWVLVEFLEEEVGKSRKLSRPWHGTYWVLERCDPT